jgi:hypothetical protein
MQKNTETNKCYKAKGQHCDGESLLESLLMRSCSLFLALYSVCREMFFPNRKYKENEKKKHR